MALGEEVHGASGLVVAEIAGLDACEVDVSLSSKLNTSGSYIRFLSCWEATVRDQSIDKYDTFHFCG